MVSYTRGRGLRKLGDAEIIARYLAGDSSTDIGLDAGCNADTVLYLVRRAGHQPRRRGGPPRQKALPLTNPEICKLYRDGISGPTIAEKCGTTPNTIYKILHAHGIERRQAGDVSRAIYAATKARRGKEPP